MSFNFGNRLNRQTTDLEAARGNRRSFFAENAIEGGTGTGRYSVPLVAHDSQADTSTSFMNTTTDSMS